MVYEDFFEFWDENYGDSLDGKRIALRAWDAAVNSVTMEMFSNSEVYTEAVLRGFEVRRTDKTDRERNKQ